MFNIYCTAAGQLRIKTKYLLEFFYKNDPGQQRAGATTTKKYPGIISSKMLIGRTLHELSVYTHRADNMVEGSEGMA